jgi:hypothetical protein
MAQGRMKTLIWMLDGWPFGFDNHHFLPTRQVQASLAGAGRTQQRDTSWLHRIS